MADLIGCISCGSTNIYKPILKLNQPEVGEVEVTIRCKDCSMINKVRCTPIAYLTVREDGQVVDGNWW